jgi:alpha-tubulin suppressor-like RCC1 family protein
MDVYPYLNGLGNNIKTAGLWNWGSNFYGRLGDNTTTDKSSPVQTITGGTNWRQVAGGGNHTAAIKTDGTLWTWGHNFYGQLGDNTSVNKSSPVQTVTVGTNWRQVECGSVHTAAIKTDGTLWLWGINNNGQLGDNTVTSKSSPVQTIAGGTNWRQVSCGDYHTAAIKTDGTLWLWGWDSNGQLGDNTTTSKSSPVQTIAGGTNWRQVACGNSHTAAVKTDGTLWTWGSNFNGILGDNTTTSKSSPVQTIAGGTNWRQVACGGHTAAIKTDGTLWLWGWNTNGQLGDSTTTSKSSPVQTIAGGTNWRQVASGAYHTAAIKTDGTLWTWGLGGSGQLGDNTTTDKSSPVQTIAGGTNWKQVACDGNHSTAIQEMGDDF